MGQSVSDVLPIDAGSQKFAGYLNPADGTFNLPVSIAEFASGGKDYGFLGVLAGYKLNTVFSAVGLTTVEDVNGESGSPTSGLDGRGFNKIGLFATVSGISANQVNFKLWRRKTQTGSNFEPPVDLGAVADNVDAFLGPFDVDTPYFMIGAVCNSGTATLTLEAYLYRA